MKAELARRQFLRFVACSPLAAAAWPLTGCASTAPRDSDHDALAPKNVFDFETLARERLGEDAYGYAVGGADDELTLQANREAFRLVQIRARRLVDVSAIDTTTTVLGQPLPAPIVIAPVGFQQVFHPQGELPVARAAAARGTLMIASSVSNASIGEIAQAGGGPLWFQLYPTTDRRITRGLLRRAEAAGCRVVALTVDTPVVGNRERHGNFLRRLLGGGIMRMGNYEGLRTNEPIADPTMTWDMIDWLKDNTTMKVVIKGVVTHEDATLCVERGADAIIVSNHGGRQEESNRGTIECLPEVVDAVGGRMPVMIDGGFRRGTDIFKALAMGADAVAVGRPYLWGLATSGQAGVEQVLDILRAELVLAMQLAGTPALRDIDDGYVTRKNCC
ncbi:MAG: alpha-hydroxy acid oxidase [Planctomycetota bacterium]|jgi:isopentenyl diphosphate isomerase/L-lactate dehydrogenase-like FMN-dependent dehydrogenase